MFNPIEPIDRHVMRISNCIDDTKDIVSYFETNNVEEDFRQNGSRLGYRFFITDSDPKYDQIHQSMLRAADIFLLSTHRNLSDYEARYNFYKIFKWETPMDEMSQHADSWMDSDNTVIPDISLVMYFTDDFEGGQVVFGAIDKTVEPKAGDIIVFDSNTLHGVNNVISGNRITTQLFLFKK